MAWKKSLFKIQGCFVVECTFIVEMIHNPHYGIYLNELSKKPERIYFNGNHSSEPGMIFNNEKDAWIKLEQEYKNDLNYIRERIKKLK